MEEEEERITYQRKMLLLSIKKIRERENEMLIQARNSFLNKRVAASENELETMLRNLEKQVRELFLRFVCSLELKWKIDASKDSVSFCSEHERK